MNKIKFLPTFLYVKRHKKTGKMYFGKTTKSDPESYFGSGKYWSRHLKTHGFDVETVWYCLFTEYDECVKFALLFSEMHNIVLSKEWLNLKPENGLDGGYPVMTPEIRMKISLSRRGKSLSTETKQKLSDSLKGKSRPKSIYTEEWRRKQRESHIGRKDSAEAFINKSKAQSGENNPRAKTWKIIDENDNCIEIKSLKTWCREQNINNDYLTKTLSSGKFYKGF
jgi:hypothetical protein